MIILILQLICNKIYSRSDLIEIKDFGDNPGNLKMFIYVPDSLRDSELVPLVVVLHGCSQNAQSISYESGWNKLADKYNFIVIYPQQKRINNPSKCYNWFSNLDIKEGKGESVSIKNMIEYTKSEYKIDVSSVFVYGLSAGAAMGVVLMANYPKMFNAGAIFAGGPYGVVSNAIEAFKEMESPNDLTPEEWGRLICQMHDSIEKYPKIVIVHGTNDKVVDIRNSYELIDQWTFLHSADTIPSRVDTAFANNPKVNRISYYNTKGEESIIFYKINNLGHQLPVDPGEFDKQGGNTGLFATDIDFYSTYYVAKDFGLIK